MIARLKLRLTTTVGEPVAKVQSRTNFARHLSALAAILFFLVGTVYGNIFVSRYDNSQVDLYDDAGNLLQRGFIAAGQGSEGFACVKLSSNRIFAANNSNAIGVFDINTGTKITSFTVGGGSIAALAINISGTILYAADYSGHIYGVDTTTFLIKYQVATAASHDIAVGPDGNIYGAYFNSHQGVQSFKPDLTPIGTFIPDGMLPYAGGMVFDGSGNLWVTNTGPAGPNDGIYEFTGPLNALPGRLLNITADPNAFPLGMDISPMNPPAPPIDACKGCIVVAELKGKNGNSIGSISQVDPSTCTGTVTSPGTCSFAAPDPYIAVENGAEPKYVHFSENCSDTGYLEICKMSCLSNPVTGLFTFTATNDGFSAPPQTIPVGACSGPIQVPNGTVSITETQQLGIEVTGITAYDYDYQGYQINALLSENLPFTTGNVNVTSGDVSTETIAGFTNCASGPGELKICKVAGQGVQIGQYFNFSVTGPNGTKNYSVPAGPAPNGYCEVGDSYDVGTSVLVQESVPTGIRVSNISVAPPDRGGKQTANSVIAIIDSGTTEVTFTDAASASLVRSSIRH